MSPFCHLIFVNRAVVHARNHALDGNQKRRIADLEISFCLFQGSDQWFGAKCRQAGHIFHQMLHVAIARLGRYKVAIPPYKICHGWLTCVQILDPYRKGCG